MLCCTHGSPVANGRETLSGQHEYCGACSNCYADRLVQTQQRHSKNVIWNLLCVPLHLGRQQSSAESNCLCVEKSTHIRKSSGLTQGAKERERETERIHCRLTGPDNVNHNEDDDDGKNTCFKLSAEGGWGLLSAVIQGATPPAASCDGRQHPTDPLCCTALAVLESYKWLFLHWQYL